MRVGTGAAGVALLALSLGASSVDAQTLKRPFSSRSDVASAARPASYAPRATTLVGALATEDATAKLKLGDEHFAAARDDEDDDDKGGRGGFLSGLGLPGGSGGGSIAGAALGGQGTRAWSQTRGVPGMGLLRRLAALSRSFDRSGASVDGGAIGPQDAAVRAAAARVSADVEALGLALAAQRSARGEQGDKAATASDFTPTPIPSTMAPGRATDTFGLDQFMTNGLTSSQVTVSSMTALAGTTGTVTAAAAIVTPEPASLVMIGSGVVALGFVGRRRRLF